MRSGYSRRAAIYSFRVEREEGKNEMKEWRSAFGGIGG